MYKIPHPPPVDEGSISTFWERSGSVIECLTLDRGWGFEPHRRHCVAVLEQDTFILP